MADKYRWNAESPLRRPNPKFDPKQPADGENTRKVSVSKGDVFEPTPEEIAAFGDLMSSTVEQKAEAKAEKEAAKK